MAEVSSAAFLVGWALIIFGAMLSFIAAIIMFLKGIRNRRVRGIRGGCLVMLGPIPIIFGTDRESIMILIILSIVLMIVAFVFMVVLGWLSLVKWS
ncbi:MAG: DUF131 domain-containing protein [Candidatus Bathyarchaeia archaeon]|nr:DUF131 domain-containing protein [Candidatus Bathyarchaeota archaeon]